MKNMASFNVHIEKYRLFRGDAGNDGNSIPTRIEALFEASFHLIEAYTAKKKVHINKHQLVRSRLVDRQDILGEDTEGVWRSFNELQNQIRPGQAYGGRIDGRALGRAKELADIIEESCLKLLRKDPCGLDQDLATW